MNPRQQLSEKARRRLVNHGIARHRQLFFETIRRNTVNSYAAAAAPARRAASRPQPGLQDIDDPLMTHVLQAGIVLAMLTTLIAVRVPLIAALRSLWSSLSGF